MILLYQYTFKKRLIKEYKLILKQYLQYIVKNVDIDRCRKRPYNQIHSNKIHTNDNNLIKKYYRKSSNYKLTNQDTK